MFICIYSSKVLGRSLEHEFREIIEIHFGTNRLVKAFKLPVVKFTVVRLV